MCLSLCLSLLRMKIACADVGAHPHELKHACATLISRAGVEKKVLMSHKISIFQLIPIVENLIPAATRGVAFLRSLREVKFCQNQAKNIDISPFFSTLARKRKISAEESPQEILDGKSIARATSCFVANAENITRSHKTASPLVRYVIKNCSCERATRVFS